MSLLTEALKFHWQSLQSAAGVSVTYLRGSISIPLDVVIGQSEFDEESSGGEIRSQTKTVDFLFPPAALVIDGIRVEPSRGDQVRYDNGELHDLMPGSDGKHWQWSDGHQTLCRIHTVRRVASK